MFGHKLLNIVSIIFVLTYFVFPYTFSQLYVLEFLQSITEDHHPKLSVD